MNEKAKGLEFPCEYPIKVFGRDEETFAVCTREIIEQHFGTLSEQQISRRASSNANYVAITYTITVQNRNQLNEIFRQLTARDDVLMAL